LMPQIPPQFEQWILLLMNVLMIEVRAENFFNFCTLVMRDPENFTDRRDSALHAAEIVDRIRQDEGPHVGYLIDFVSELRSFTFKTVEGGQAKGAAFIDPVWRGMVHWHAVANVDFNREQARKHLAETLGRELMAEFDSLEER